jgi:hypothetical protein
MDLGEGANPTKKIAKAPPRGLPLQKSNNFFGNGVFTEN